MLILGSSAEQRRVWNELMAHQHPQGAARHVEVATEWWTVEVAADATAEQLCAVVSNL